MFICSGVQMNQWDLGVITYFVCYDEKLVAVPDASRLSFVSTQAFPGQHQDKFTENKGDSHQASKMMLAKQLERISQSMALFFPAPENVYPTRITVVDGDALSLCFILYCTFLKLFLSMIYNQVLTTQI